MIWRDFIAKTTQEYLLSTCFMHLFYVDGNAGNFRTNIFVLSSLRSISTGPRVNLDEKIRCRFLISHMKWRGFRTTIVWKHLLSASFTHFLDIHGNTINYGTKVLLLSLLRFILVGPRGKMTEKIMSWIFYISNDMMRFQKNDKAERRTINLFHAFVWYWWECNKF